LTAAILSLGSTFLLLGCGSDSTSKAPPGFVRQSANEQKTAGLEIDLSAVEVAPLENMESNTVGIFFCLDVSPSMNEKVGKRSKIEISKDAMRTVLLQLEAFSQASPTKKLSVGIVVFGGKAKLLAPVAPFDRGKLEKAIQSVSTIGGTAIGEGMLLALREMVAIPFETRALIVMTDGENNAGAPPEKVVAAIKANRNDKQALTDDIKISLVAFDISANLFAPVKSAGASVVESRDQDSLAAMLTKSVEEAVLEKL
jgi:Mg-chelatase subunit ChlD